MFNVYHHHIIILRSYYSTQHFLRVTDFLPRKLWHEKIITAKNEQLSVFVHHIATECKYDHLATMRSQGKSLSQIVLKTVKLKTQLNSNHCVMLNSEYAINTQHLYDYLIDCSFLRVLNKNVFPFLFNAVNGS